MDASAQRDTGTAAVHDLVGTFVPSGSHCLHVDGRVDGAMSRWLRDRGYRYVQIQPRALDAGRLPFAAESFDAGLILGILGRLDQPQRAVAELHRVLRPGGVLLTTVANDAYWRRRLGPAAARRAPWHSFTPRRLRHLLLGAGFSLVGVEGQGSAFVRMERLFPALLGPQAAAFAIKGAGSRTHRSDP